MHTIFLTLPHVLTEPEDEIAVAALTDCSIGIIDYRDLDRLIARYSTLGLALWRATMLEASISRQKLLNVSRRPALQRQSASMAQSFR